MTRRLFGLLCVKNEADRYLYDCLNWNNKFLDHIFVFDDASEDETPELARTLGATVVARSEDEPSFMQHEGAFRQASWNAFERTMQPTEDDWVLVIDADQFLVVNEGSERSELLNLAKVSEHAGFNAAWIKVVEIFDVVENLPFQRIDGYWDAIEVPHFFQYQRNGEIKNLPLGCGSAPTYVHPGPGTALSVQILHYGYVSEQDRTLKHGRYAAIVNNGHAPAHIASIVHQGLLRPWTGKIPS